MASARFSMLGQLIIASSTAMALTRSTQLPESHRDRSTRLMLLDKALGEETGYKLTE